MSRVTVLLAVAALAVVAAGCGGNNPSSADTSATTTETTTTETTATETTTETATETQTDTGSASGGFASGDCLKLVQSSQELSQALSAAGTSSGDLKNAAKLFQNFVDKAPSEIKADLQVLADAYTTYINALGSANLQPGQTPDAKTLQKLQQAAASIDQQKVTAASQRLSTWAHDNCPNSG